jgi:hypothetical protein
VHNLVPTLKVFEEWLGCTLLALLLECCPRISHGGSIDMINKQTAAALAFIASLSINAGYAADEQASKTAPAPIASQPVAEDVKAAPQPAASEQQAQDKTADQQPQSQQAK